MSISTAITSRLAQFLGVPRKYAVGNSGAWRRIHRDINPQEFHQLLTTGPLCVSVRSTNGVNDDTGYSGNQHFAIFDVDAEDHFSGAKIVAHDIAVAIKSKPGYDCLVTFSGKKGFHIWVFFDDDLHHTVVADWQHDVLTALGFERVQSNKYEKEGVHVETLITFGDNNGLVIKVPWSSHQSRDGFYEMPISVDEILDYDKDTPPTEAQWHRSIGIFEQVRPVEMLLVLMETGGEGTASTAPTRRRNRPTPRLGPFTIPQMTDEVSHHLASLLETVNETPCLKVCMERSMHEHGIYWLRAVLVAVLGARGFSRQIIGVFFRDIVNDDEDNHNTGVLESQINYWYSRRGICACRVLGNPTSRFYCCPRVCGRTNPKKPEPMLRIPFPPPINITVDMMFDNIYQGEQGKVFQICGTMRARKTTGAILGAIRNEKKAVVVVPRLSIVRETGGKVLQHATERGLHTYTCCIPDNRPICLKWADEIKHLHETLGLSDSELHAIEMLKRVEKPDCKNCPFKNNIIPESELQPNVIYGESDTEARICGYQTILQYAHLWKLIWVCDKKFISIANAQGNSWTTPMMEIIGGTDVYILDEVSHFLETPSFDLDIRKLEATDTRKEYKFIQHLRSEIAQLQTFLTGNTLFRSSNNTYARDLTQLHTLNGHVSDEIEIQSNRIIINPDEGTFVYPREITDDEATELRKLSTVILRSVMFKAQFDNVALNSVIDLFDLALEGKWIFTNVPNEEFTLNISLKIAPKVADYVSILRESGATVIAIDATPPAIPLERVFHTEVTKFNIGDPYHTNDKFLIIPDTVKIYASKMNTNHPENIARADNWIKWAIRLFGEEALGMLTTSMKQCRAVRRRFENEYPNLDMPLYHRGQHVIGVAYDKRVGISLCAPLAPKTAAHWLKVYYKEELADVSATQLWRHEQARQTQQAEARFKDPQAVEPSVVFAFGQTDDIVEDSYTNAIVQPRVLKTVQQRGGTPDECPIQLIQGAIWKRMQTLVEDPTDLKAIIGIMRGKDNRAIHQSCNINVGRIEEIRESLALVIPEILSKLK